MKVAVVTEDGNTISQHFGRAPYFEVFTVEDGLVTARERREKPAHGGHGHHHEPNTGIQLVETAAPLPDGGHGAMVDPIRDCEALIGRGMGQGAYGSLKSAGIRVILTDIRDIDEAIVQYGRGELADHPERLH